MSRKANLLALLAAAALTALAVAGLTQASSSAKPINNSPPTISGTPAEGQTLSAKSGDWSGAGPVEYSFQWRRCDKDGGSCSNISGATSDSYTLKHVDIGNTMRVRQLAKNSDGTTSAESAPTAVVKSSAPPPNTTGCPSGSGAVSASDLTPPARLLVDGQQANPSVVNRSTGDLVLRFHVTACDGRDVSGALVYATAIPYEQFSVPNEVQTGSDGWAQVTLHQASRFPASSRQQLLAVFVRARKPGDSLLGGISTRRLVSFPVRL